VLQLHWEISLTGHYIHDKVKKGEDSDMNFLRSYVQAQFLLTLEDKCKIPPLNFFISI